MISQLLPGFRHVRAPIAAGFLWIGFFWLAIRRFGPQDADADWLRPLEEFLDLFGTAGRAALISGFAYLVGSLAVGGVRLLGLNREKDEVPRNVHLEWLIASLWTPRLAEAVRVVAFEEGGLGQVHVSLDGVAEKEVAEMVGLFVADNHKRWSEEAPITPYRYLCHELKEYRIEAELEDRLLAANPALHSSYGRLVAEWDLRQSIVAPAVASVALLMLDAPFSPGLRFLAVVATMGLAALLYYQGLDARKRSRELLARAITTGVIGTPLIDALRLASAG